MAESVGDLFARVFLDSKSWDEGVAKIQTGLNGLQANIEEQNKKWESFSMVGQKLSTVGKDLTVGVTMPLAALSAASLKASGDFESAMNKVSAQGDITGANLAKLKAQAEDLGAKTQFSSRQAAEGMAQLASAGQSTEEIFAAMPGVMNLAAAAGTSVADSATVAKDILGQFGLAATDTAHVVDVLAKAGTESSGTLTDMANTMTYVGPGAKAMGMSIEQTSAAILALDKAGLRGEKAGTGLRNMLTSLVAPSAKAAETLNALGVKTSDSSGKFLPFSAIMEQFRVALAKIPSEAEKAAALVKIFGESGFSASNILTSKGAPALLDFEGKLTNVDGTAQRVSATMNQGLNGAMERMGGSVETAGQKIGEVLTPAAIKLAGAVEWAANKIGEFAAWFKTLPEGVQNATIAFGLFAGSLGPVMFGLGQVAKIIVDVNAALPIAAKAMDLFKASTAASLIPLAAWVGLITAGIAGIAIIVKSIYDYRQALNNLNKVKQEGATADKKLEDHLRSQGFAVDDLKKKLASGEITQLKYAQTMREFALEAGKGKAALDANKPPLTEAEKLMKAYEEAMRKAAASNQTFGKTNDEAAKKAAHHAELVRDAWDAAHERADKAAKDAEENLKWFEAAYKKIEELDDQLAKSAFDLANDYARAHEQMRLAALKTVEITVPLSERIPKQLQETIDKQKALAKAYEVTGQTSVDELNRQWEETSKAYDLIVEASGESSYEAGRAWIAMEEARVKATIAAGGAITEEQRKTLEAMKELYPDLEAKTKEHHKKTKDLWQEWSKDIADAIGNFMGATFDRLFHGSKENERLDAEAAKLRESLAERKGEYEQYVADVNAQLDQLHTDYVADLAAEDAELAASLADAAQNWDDYVADVEGKIDDISEKHRTAVEQETENVAEAIADKMESYAEYEEQVTEKLVDIKEKWDEQLAEETESLRRSLADRQQDYDDFVDDANTKLSRLGGKYGDNIEDETQDTERSIRDRTKDYNRYAEDVADKIRRLREKNKGQNSEEEADLQKSLQRKKEDLDQYVADQKADLEEYKREQQQRLAEEEADLKESLARKQRDHEQFIADNKAKQDQAYEDYQKGLTKETDAAKQGLADRKADLDKFVLDKTAALDRFTAEHQKAETKEIEQQRTAMATKKGEYDAHVTEMIAASERRKNDITTHYEAETAALHTELGKQTTEYQTWVTSITGPGGELEKLKEAHRTIWDDIKGFGLNAISDIGASLMDLISERILGKVMHALGEAGLSGILDKLGEKMGSIIGTAGETVAKGVGGAADAAGGAAGSAGGAAAAVGSGLMGTIGAVAGVVSAISSVIGNFQMAGMNKTLDLIEKEVRYSQIHLLHILEDGVNKWLPHLDTIDKWLQTDFHNWFAQHMDTTEQILACMKADGYMGQRIDSIKNHMGWGLEAWQSSKQSLFEIKDAIVDHVYVKLDSIVANTGAMKDTLSGMKSELSTARSLPVNINVNATGVTPELSRQVGNQIATNLTTQLVAV